jgi:hypothetical protein
MRHTSALVLVLGIAAMASASAYAGNGNGNGNGNGKSDAPAAAAVVAVESSGHGNSAVAPGQLKKDDAPVAAAASITQAAETTQTAVKPSNDTAHDTHAAASSNRTKLYGNGNNAGQIATQNGAAPSTVLHGPGNSQPHKAAPCSGGHEVDVHALKAKRGKRCGTSPPTRPRPTPDPGKPGDPAHGPNAIQGTPAAPQSSAVDPKTPTKSKPAVDPKQGGGEAGAGVLSGTGEIGALPFTGYPIWLAVLIAVGLIGFGLFLRRTSSAPSR